MKNWQYKERHCEVAVKKICTRLNWDQGEVALEEMVLEGNASICDCRIGSSVWVTYIHGIYT